MQRVVLALAIFAGAIAATNAAAADVKVLSAGAFKQVLLAVVPDFEKRSGHKVMVANDTVGALVKRIEGGETFDVAVLTPAAVDELARKERIVPGTRAAL